MAARGAEDEKLFALARAARARIGAAEGAAVRDETGRSYAAATVDRPNLRISALDLAVAQAAAAGAEGLEAALVVSKADPAVSIRIASVTDYGTDIPVHVVRPNGDAAAELST